MNIELGGIDLSNKLMLHPLELVLNTLTSLNLAVNLLWFIRYSGYPIFCLIDVAWPWRVKGLVSEETVLYLDWKWLSGWRFDDQCGCHLLDSEDGFRTDCRNVSPQQQSFSGLQSPRWSFSIKLCYSWAQTISLIYRETRKFIGVKPLSFVLMKD